MKFLVATAFVGLASIALPWEQACGQDKLSLEQAIREAMEKSPELRKFSAKEQEEKWHRVESRAGVLPRVSLFADHYFTTQYETVPVTVGANSLNLPLPYPVTAYGLEANWTIFNGLANWRDLEAASLKDQAANFDLKRKALETRKSVELGYYAVLAAQEMSEVAKRNLKTVEENLSHAKFRLSSGASTEPDVLRVQVQQTEARAEADRTADNIVIGRERLRQIMGLAHDDRELSGTLPVPDAQEKVSRLSSSVVENRDDITSLQLIAMASEESRKAGNGSLYPSVSLVGRVYNYDITDYSLPGAGGSSYPTAYNIGIALKWNIFDGGASLAQPGIGAARAEQAESELRASLLGVQTEFELWRRRYLYSAKLFAARMEDIKRSEESLRIITFAFQQGSRIFTEVLDAETDLFRARAGAVQSQFEAVEALTRLELVIGKDLQ